ncbi:hypothetical protein WMY93_033141, partial [Mugilogobius chulae]
YIRTEGGWRVERPQPYKRDGLEGERVHILAADCGGSDSAPTLMRGRRLLGIFNALGDRFAHGRAHVHRIKCRLLLMFVCASTMLSSSEYKACSRPTRVKSSVHGCGVVR